MRSLAARCATAKRYCLGTLVVRWLHSRGGRLGLQERSTNKYAIVATVAVEKVVACPSHHDAQIMFHGKANRRCNLRSICGKYDEGWVGIL